MLCYVMLCYVMLCYVMLCYVMLCYVYVMLCYVSVCLTKNFKKAQIMLIIITEYMLKISKTTLSYSSILCYVMNVCYEFLSRIASSVLKVNCYQ